MAPRKLHMCTRKNPVTCVCVLVYLGVMVLCSLFRGFELLTPGISIMRRGLGLAGDSWGNCVAKLAALMVSVQRHYLTHSHTLTPPTTHLNTHTYTHKCANTHLASLISRI